MRFAIATGAVLAQSLLPSTVGSSSPSESKSEPLTLQQHDQRRRQNQKTPGKQGMLHHVLLQQNRQSNAAAGLMKNVNKESLQECIPNSVDPPVDIGVLSCGHGRYCVESSDSSSGGYCVSETQLPGRRRQQVVGRLSIIEIADLFCNRPEETGLSVDCNCTVDFTNGSGEFSCSFGPDCVDVKSGCADETFPLCSTEQLTAKIEGTEQYTYTSCYSQTLPLTNERFSYCTDFGYTKEDGPTCGIQVEGVPCNSCSIAIGGGEEFGENCEVFDCSNTIVAYTGDRCGAFSTPALRSVHLVEYMYEEKWPCPDGCNLCGNGGRMTMGNNTFTYPSQLLVSNLSIPCYDLQYDALTGGLAEGGYCVTFPPLVESLCGCLIPPTEAPVGMPSVNTPVDTPAGSPTVTAPTLGPAPSGAATPVIRHGEIFAGILAAAALVWVW
ncbi:hypothetical protein IV203_013475 [Nitzschia inconspicua]|uniref:Uncharacterized protein n=1 Tax=Nitzschia inconspicua TaxID=303405 RepID=A0A9K3Q8T2_9STRA|nr:hypothetical protein IV203_013475 [Nitzschia inconspicua]